jgi:putative endonuclease
VTFWVYMLHCNGGRIYVGQTDDLERRIYQHEHGIIPGFSADHRPIKLIWSDAFETRDAAREFESKLKGWSKAKKLALVRGDWAEISRLARGRSQGEGRPSTSSGTRI